MALRPIGIYLFVGLLWATTIYASSEYNRYVTQIFEKYGSGNTISFEVTPKKSPPTGVIVHIWLSEYFKLVQFTNNWIYVSVSKFLIILSKQRLLICNQLGTVCLQL